MADYIAREAVRNELYDADAITMKGVAILNNFPSADVVEVVHGWWIWKDGKCFCSACSKQGEPKCVYQDGAVDEYPYCPECGAKMDLEEK